MSATFIIIITSLIYIGLIIIASYLKFFHKIKKYEKNKLKAFWIFIIIFMSGMISGRTIEELLNEKINKKLFESKKQVVKTSKNPMNYLKEEYSQKDEITLKSSDNEIYTFYKKEGKNENY